MNILVLSWRDPKHPQSGGAEQVMHEHMKGWVENGHKVILISSFYKGCKKKEVLDGVIIERMGLQLVGVQISAFFWYIFKRNIKFDLIIDQFHGLPFFTPLYVRVPIVAVVQEVAKEVWLNNQLPKPFNFVIGHIGYFGEPFLYYLYKKNIFPGSRNVNFMTGSESAKKDLIKIGIDRNYIEVVNHGIEKQGKFEKSSKEKNKTITFLGAVTRDKGIIDALNVFRELSKIGNYYFWLIGKIGIGFDQELFALIDEYGLTNRIKIWGYVEKSKKYNLLSRSHVLINPSIHEGFGLVNIEANSVGTPVVGYKVGGLVDSVKDQFSGVLVNKNKSKLLAKEIDKLLKNKNKYKAMTQTCVKWAANFTWPVSKRKSLLLIKYVAKLK